MKTFRFFILIKIFLLLLLTSLPAKALFIEKDFFAANDKLLTIDTRTRLEWLDVSATLNVSVNQIRAGYGGYLSDHGFRYMTNSELFGLLDSAGGDNALGYQKIIALLGCTFRCGTTNEGQFGLTVESSGGVIEYFGFASGVSGSDPPPGQTDFANVFAGHYLVRDAVGVAEPGLLFLFSALGCLLVLRRKF